MLCLYCLSVLFFFFFQYLTMAFLDIKSRAFWIRDTLKTGSEKSEYGLSVHNRSQLACLELLVKNSLRTWGWVALELPLGCRTGTSVQIRSKSTPVSATWHKAGAFSHFNFSFSLSYPGSSQQTDTILQIAGSNVVQGIGYTEKEGWKGKKWTPR